MSAHPDLVWVIDDPAAGEVQEDRAVVVAVGRGPAPPETADLLRIGDYAAMALFGADPATSNSSQIVIMSSRPARHRSLTHRPGVREDIQ